MKNLKEMINQNAESHGENPAFLYKGIKGGVYQEISHRDFKADVDALGTKLLKMGLKGEKIAVIGSNCYSWVVAYFAIVCGVGCVVPLDKELSKEENINLLEHSKCRAVFYTEEFDEIFKDIDIEYKIRMKQFPDGEEKSPTITLKFEDLISDGKKLLSESNREFVDAEVNSTAMNMLLYTSGTTGAAKGVMLSHANIMSNVEAVFNIVEIYPDDRTLSILPIHHTFESNIGIITVLTAGASIAFGEGLKYVANNLAEAEATALVGVPLIFESMYNKIWKEAEKTGKAKTLKRGIRLNRTLKAMGIRQEKRIFSSIYKKFGGKLRMLVTGAAAIDPNVIRGFEDLGIMVLQGYGLTECSPLVSGTPEKGNRYMHAGSVGPSVTTGEVKVINPDSDGIGEIVFRGSNLMLGYYEMPHETNKVMIDGWFYTGDLGFLNNEGWLYITGRKKNVIVTKTGKNIYPEEIEAYLLKNRFIEEVIVHGKESDSDDSSEVTVSALIRPNYDLIKEEKGEAHALDDDKVYMLIKQAVSDLNEGLPNYKRIRNVGIKQDEFVKTTTKKIKRHQNI